MKMNKYILLAAIGMGMISMNACTDDSSVSVSGDSQKDNTKDDGPNGNKKDDDNPGKKDDDKKDDDNPGKKDEQNPESCKDQCAKDTKRCEDNKIWLCDSSESECLEWRIIKECPSGTQCDEESFSCKADCSTACDPNALMRCDGNSLQKCETDENGCVVWSEEEQCEDGCDQQSLACRQVCKSECSPGEKKCSDSGIATCMDSDGKGCGAWGNPEPCETGKECKENPVECVASCTSECEAGKEEFLAASYRVCKDSDGHGCMKWETQTTCQKGEEFDKASKQCKPVCGDNCEKFSIVFLPDTQEYVRNAGGGEILRKQLDWINKNYKSKDWNIKAVMHLGDMTDTNDPKAWAMNDEAYRKYLDSIDLAYLPGTGNHDYLMCADNDSAVATCYYSRGGTRFSSHGKFNNDRFKNKNWSYAKFGTFKYTGNSYLTMTVSGIKFLLIALEFAPRKDTLCWAEEIIGKHPDHKVIITTHAYLNSYADTVERDNKTQKYGRNTYTAGSGPDSLATGAHGFEVYQELAARHNNIILVASGHVSSNTFRIHKGNADNWFNEMLVDYQTEDPANGRCAHSHANGGSGGGWMRILTFDPANYTIQANTITPLPDSYFYKNKKWFYCSPDPEAENVCYEADPNKTPAAPLSAEDIAKANTTTHKFTVNYDFVTPVDYKKTDGNVGFTHMFVNDISSGNQNNPAIAMNRKTRDFVVVWSDEAYDSDADSGKDTDGTGNHDIRARVMCEIGCPKVSQFTVNTTTAGHQRNPDVAMNTAGDFVVVWTNAQDNSVYMRKFDSAGKELVKETKVNTSGKADMPTVGIAGDGSYVVTWQDGDIYMRGFDAKGSELFSQRKVAASDLEANGRRNLPDIGMAEDGAFVITWEDDVDGNETYEIRARGFNKDGSERIKQIAVNVVSDNQQRDPSIGMNSKGDFFIAWEDDTDGNEIYRIRMRAFDRDGKETTKDTFVSTPGQDATDPSICMTDNGVAFFSWAAKEFEKGSTTYKNVAMHSRSDKLSDELLVSPIYSGTQDQPAIACAANTRNVVVWHDDLDGNDYYEIMCKGF